jgi:membrane protease YdiL (CAAX protease family)
MQKQFFPHVPQVSRSLLYLFVAVDYVLVTLVILLFATGWLTPIAQATAGLINRTLLGNLPLLLLAVGGVMLWLGKLRARDIGLVWSQLLTGLAFTAALWVVVQLIELVLGFAANGTVTLAAEWSQLGIIAVLGGLLGQLFGNALYEELAYRGFLLPQVWARLSDRWPKRPLFGLVVALLVTQALFSLRHIPIRILQGTDPVDIALSLVMVMGIGLIYALLYLRTNNLFLVIGVHALRDAATPLFTSTFVESYTLVLVLTVALLLAWPLFTRRQGKPAQLRMAASA